MSANPYFPFYPSDWLAGTAALNAAEKGVYVTILCLIYESEAPVPMNEDRLSRLCGCGKAALRKALSGLIETGKLTETEDGLWNERAGIEIEKRHKVRKKARDAASQRWSKSHGKTQKNQRKRDATASPKQCPDDAYQNQNQNHSKTPSSPPEGEAGERATGRDLFGGSEPPEATPAQRRAKRPPQNKRVLSPTMQRQFDEWWKLYPNKVAIAAARGAFQDALDKIDLDTLCDRTRAYAARIAANQRPDLRLPNPATWLNDERWNDEPATPPGPGGNAGGSGDREFDWFKRQIGEIDRGKPSPKGDSSSTASDCRPVIRAIPGGER